MSRVLVEVLFGLRISQLRYAEKKKQFKVEGNSKVGLNFLGFSSYQTIIICEQLRRLTDEKIRLCRNSYFF